MGRTKARYGRAAKGEADHVGRPSVPADVVDYLRTEKGMTLQQIARMTGTTESFISRVASGGRNFTLEHLYRIETHLKEPLPLLLLRAMPRQALPEQFQPLYDQAAELLKALGESRAPFSPQPGPATKPGKVGGRKAKGRGDSLVRAL